MKLDSMGGTRVQGEDVFLTVAEFSIALTSGVGLTPQPGLYFVGLPQQLAAATVGITRTVFLRPG